MSYPPVLRRPRWPDRNFLRHDTAPVRPWNPLIDRKWQEAGHLHVQRRHLWRGIRGGRLRLLAQRRGGWRHSMPSAWPAS